MRNLLDMPIWQMTGAEFLELQAMAPAQKAVEARPDSQSPRHVHGLRGLQELLQCSHTTASQLKSSGVLDGCYTQYGRKIVFNAEAVLSRYGQYKKGGRK